MHIACDMDEFFRQHDPQYVAEHPEEHAARKEIYANLMAGRIAALDEKLAALGQAPEGNLSSEIEKFKDATGYEEFLDVDPAVIREAIQNPDKSHVDEMLAFAERVGREYAAEQNGNALGPSAPGKLTVLVVEPRKVPYLKEIAPGLHALQAEVGGDISTTYPFSDPVGLVCNDEGKLSGLELNRGLRDEEGNLFDIVAGTFLVVGLDEENFTSLSPELAQKYSEYFNQPEQFLTLNGQLNALPVDPQTPLCPAEKPRIDDCSGCKEGAQAPIPVEFSEAPAEKKSSVQNRLEKAKERCDKSACSDRLQQGKFSDRNDR